MAKLKIKKLDLLLLKMYVGPLILTFFIAVFVLLMQFLWKYIDDLVGKGLDFWILAKLLFFASTTFIPMALPIAILLSSLMTVGNFGEHYELAASKSVGISLLKIMRPLIILNIFISVAAFYFSNNILPVANLKMSAVLYDVSNAKPALNIREGIFYREIDNYIIKIGRKEKDGKTIRKVLIYDHSKFTGNTTVTIAESGHMEMTDDEKFLIIKLFNGYYYNEPLDKREYYETRPVERINFREQIKRFDLSSFSMQKTNEDLFKDHYQMMSIGQLQTSIDSLNREKIRLQKVFSQQITSYWHFYTQIDSTIISNPIPPELVGKEDNSILELISAGDKKFITQNALKSAQSIHEIAGYQSSEIDSFHRHFLRYNVEFHRKFTLSVACFILFFIGAPLGAIIRKGGLGLPLVVATLIFVAYYILSITGEKFVRESIWNPAFGMWLSSFVLFPFGLWLTLKTIQDSPLMDIESWYRYTSRIIHPLKKLFK